MLHSVMLCGFPCLLHKQVRRQQAGIGSRKVDHLPEHGVLLLQVRLPLCPLTHVLLQASGSVPTSACTHCICSCGKITSHILGLSLFKPAVHWTLHKCRYRLWRTSMMYLPSPISDEPAHSYCDFTCGNQDCTYGHGL